MNGKISTRDMTGIKMEKQELLEKQKAAEMFCDPTSEWL